ncbi:MAG: hypothetical protein QNI84_15955 [Henriciella sp.]|nr:hypothetical protein [Henriciella sp.]
MRSETAISVSDILLQMPLLNAILIGLAIVFTITATILIAIEIRTQLEETAERAPIRPLSVTSTSPRED